MRLNTSKRFIEDYLRINAADYVRAFVRHIEFKEGRTLRANSLGGAQHMQELLHIPENTREKSVRDITTGEYFWGEQKVIFVPSNLGQGRGHIWYFVCNGCNKQVKYVYETSMLKTPVCQTCSGLNYRQATRRERSISKLLNKPYLSTEAKYLLIKLIGIKREDVPVV